MWSKKGDSASPPLWTKIGQSDSTLCAQASMIISKHRLDFNRPAFVFFIPSIAFRWQRVNSGLIHILSSLKCFFSGDVDH